ncbi:conserved hypothetical protein, partial [Ricinus communis]
MVLPSSEMKPGPRQPASASSSAARCAGAGSNWRPMAASSTKFRPCSQPMTKPAAGAGSAALRPCSATGRAPGRSRSCRSTARTGCTGGSCAGPSCRPGRTAAPTRQTATAPAAARAPAPPAGPAPARPPRRHVQRRSGGVVAHSSEKHSGTGEHQQLGADEVERQAGQGAGRHRQQRRQRPGRQQVDDHGGDAVVDGAADQHGAEVAPPLAPAGRRHGAGGEGPTAVDLPGEEDGAQEGQQARQIE